MPSRPPSPAASAGTVIAVLAVATEGLFANTRTAPPFSSTYHRDASPGACSISSGWLNVRLGNTRCVVTVAPALADFAGARQVVFDGRASSPAAGGVGVGDGSGLAPSFDEE